MKRVLLISNYVFHYRIKIYNYFYRRFGEMGWEFYVLSDSYQDVNYAIEFVKHQEAFSIKKYIKKINEIKPDVIITFLHLKDILIFPLTYYCKYKKIPIIYWNHGINLRQPDNVIKNMIFRYVHDISDAIILYTPNEIKYISKKNRGKTFIAYNTLFFQDIDKRKLADRKTIKAKYHIKEDKLVLYISRIQEYKKLDILLEILKDLNDVGLVVVGAGITSEQLNSIQDNRNFYYLGEKYDSEVHEIFSIGDIYSTPGHIGLGLNEAFFWGKPVVVLDGKHAPEIYYLKHGKNGFIAKDKVDLKKKIIYLLTHDELYESFSKNALATIETEAGIERMFNGFKDAIAYVSDSRSFKNRPSSGLSTNYNDSLD